jgi:predicted Zn finger-like uncharacterized protein
VLIIKGILSRDFVFAGANERQAFGGELIMAAKTGMKQQCPHCEAVLPIKEAQIGKRIKCAKCGEGFLVEDPDEAATAPTEKIRRGQDKQKPVKGKTAPGRQRDDDDTPKLKKKRNDGNTKTLLGVVAGVVALAVLGVAGYFVFFKKEDKPKTPPIASSPTTPPPVTPSDPPSPTTADNTTTPAPAGTETPGVTSPSTVATTFAGAPLNTMLLNDTQAVLNIDMKNVFKNPLGIMAFDHTAVTRSLGIPVDSIEQIIASGSISPPWNVVFIRTNKPIRFDDVTKALRLKPAEGSPRLGQDFFTMHTNWGEVTNSFLPEDYRGAVNRSSPIAVRLHDPQTLVMGDLEPLKKFLDVKGQPRPHDPPPTPGNQAGATPGFPQVGVSPGGDQTAPLTSNYRTVNHRLKGMLDQMETNAPFLLSAAVDNKVKGDDDGVVFEVTTAGVSVHWPGGKERMVVMAAVECPNDQIASNLKQRYDQLITQVARPALLEKWKIKTGTVTKPGTKTETAPGVTPPGGGGNSPPRPGGKAPPGGEVPPQPPGGTPPPGGRPGNPEEIPDALMDARVTVDMKQQGKSIVALIDFDVEQKVYDLIFETARPYITRIHGELEMATSQPHPTQLGTAAKSYSQKEEQFPAAVNRRDPSAARFKRPWPPHQRIGWMAELLPYLGHERVYNQIDFKRSWSDDENLNVASTLIPQFLAPDAPHNTWYVKHPDVGPEVAATNYVGIAGIGLDAAAYDSANPQRGIFGYDRPTRLSEIENPAKTILLIQVPPTKQGPWLAGGGTTVRGVPETKSIEAFLPPKGREKRGTHLIMADGSVRYVSENISDEVLKTLAVIKGKKAEINVDKEAPVVPPPTETELKTVTAPPSPTAPTPATSAPAAPPP